MNSTRLLSLECDDVGVEHRDAARDVAHAHGPADRQRGVEGQPRASRSPAPGARRAPAAGRGRPRTRRTWAAARRGAGTACPPGSAGTPSSNRTGSVSRAGIDDEQDEIAAARVEPLGRQVHLLGRGEVHEAGGLQRRRPHGRALGGDQAAGLDVVCVHRARAVEHQHQRCLPDRHPGGHVRARERDRERRDRSEHCHDRHVPAPVRTGPHRRHNRRHRRKPQREPPRAPPGQPLHSERRPAPAAARTATEGRRSSRGALARCRDDSPLASAEQPVFVGAHGHVGDVQAPQVGGELVTAALLELLERAPAPASTTCRPRRGGRSRGRPARSARPEGSVASRGSHTSTAKGSGARRPQSAA